MTTKKEDTNECYDEMVKYFKDCFLTDSEELTKESVKKVKAIIESHKKKETSISEIDSKIKDYEIEVTNKR